MEELLKKINEELATMKIMIYSLYKSITLDDELKEAGKWEKECKEIAKRVLNKQKESDKNE